VLERVNDIDWIALAQPAENGPDTVANALRRVAAASTDAEGSASVNALLSGVGNNHAGTYYPVVVAVVPFLGEILDNGAVEARRAALDVLVDVVETFEPESGFDTTLRVRLLEAVSRVRPSIERIALPDRDDRERKLATDLLAALDEQGRSRVNADHAD
jgi:hypothetical protein